MLKYIIGVIIFVAVAVGGYYAWEGFGTSIVPPPAAPLPPPAPSTTTYATSTFSLTYPSTYTVDEAYAYDQFEKKPIAGVKFIVPTSMADGTNLGSGTGVSVEWLPRAQKCTGDIYIVPNVKTTSLVVGSTTFSVATTSEAAAGNLYEEQVFAIADSKPCTAVRYFIHSTNIANYPTEGEGAVREFDRGALIREFDGIRNSLVLTQ